MWHSLCTQVTEPGRAVQEEQVVQATVNSVPWTLHDLPGQHGTHKGKKRLKIPAFLKEYKVGAGSLAPRLHHLKVLLRDAARPGRQRC